MWTPIRHCDRAPSSEWVRRMAETTTRLGPSGRIVIPAEYRKAVGLEIGDEVVLRLEAGEIRIMGRAQAVRRAQQLVRRYVSADRSLSEELIATRRAEADRA
jgi:AbrB family looped-hinge helix DNA binding protein